LRDNNEDAFLADDELGLYVVSDGMGGHAAGDLAAELAVEAVRKFIVDEPLPDDPRDVIEHMRAAVEEANRVVFERASTDPRLQGMGCTLTAVLVADTFAACAHVGDSRCYILRDGEVDQLTRDHTLVAEWVRQGLLTEQEAEKSEVAHVLARAVGVNEQVSVDAFGVELEEGDHVLLCSDGLTRHVQSLEWLAEKLEGENLDGVASELIEYANREGGEDNVTAVVISVENDAISSGVASNPGR
jgi:protein phosphatase